jgi:threonine aldolase
MPLYWEKARTIAPRLAALPGVEVSPSMPQTNMFHVHVRASRERLDEAALDVAEATGVWMFGRVATSDPPTWARVEVACGDATLEMADDEIVGLFENLLVRVA